MIPLTGSARVVLEVLWFGGGARGAGHGGQRDPRVVFAAVYLVNAALRLLWNQ